MKVGLITDDVIGDSGDFVEWKTTGVGRYSQGLHQGLSREGISVELIHADSPNIPLGDTLKHLVTMPNRVRGEIGLLDLIHASSPITALCFGVIRKPKVVTYHDLVPLLCRKAGDALHTRLFAPFFLRVGKLADQIIAISSQTKQEMIGHLGIPVDKITVVNYGVSEMFRPIKTQERRHKVLGYVGTLDRRKAVDYLMKAVYRFKQKYPATPIRLIICGSKGQEYGTLVRLADTLNIAEDVEFKGLVVGDELVRAYNSFDVLVHPSEWEGFGFPILEAQRCGVPVIIREDARIPREVSECCLKASSEKDMADKIYALMTDVRRRLAIVEQGLEYSQQFTWARTVQLTMEVYERALGCGRGPI